MIRARIRVDGRLAGGLQAFLGAPMAACSGCGERDGGIGHGKRRSRTGLARVVGDVQLAGWRASSSRLTRSSWRTCPHLKLRRKAPRMEGALTTLPRVQAVPPVRNTSASSMQSPPASAEVTRVEILSPGLARPGGGRGVRGGRRASGGRRGRCRRLISGGWRGVSKASPRLS